MCDTKDRYNFEQACEVVENLNDYVNGFKGTTNNYNGWSNYDTWKFNLNITNEYEVIKSLENNIKEMSLKEFILQCINPNLNSMSFLSAFVDRINFTEVNFKEVYEALKEDY